MRPSWKQCKPNASNFRLQQRRVDEFETEAVKNITLLRLKTCCLDFPYVNVPSTDSISLTGHGALCALQGDVLIMVTKQDKMNLVSNLQKFHSITAPFVINQEERRLSTCAGRLRQSFADCHCACGAIHRRRRLGHYGRVTFLKKKQTSFASFGCWSCFQEEPQDREILLGVPEPTRHRHWELGCSGTSVE